MKDKASKQKYYADSTQQESRGTKPVSEKIDFMTKIGTRDKEGYFIIIKKTIYMYLKRELQHICYKNWQHGRET